MRHFAQVAHSVDVSGVLADLDAHPELWGQNTARTEAGSPHEGVPDIWLRTRPPGEHGRDGVFVPEFWPAWHALPSVAPLAFALMARFRAVQLGNILITHIPAGGEVKAHVDRGWSPEFFDIKTYIVLQSNDSCVNWCEDEHVVMKTGDAWLFQNTVPHGVINGGSESRKSLIITMRSV
jgi:hypothetical protein